MMDLREMHELTMLFISHEMPVVKALCDTVAVMYLGQIVEQAPASLFFEEALHPYSIALMSAVPEIEASKQPERIILSGDIPSPVDVKEGCRFASRCFMAKDICCSQAPGLRPMGTRLVRCNLV